MVYAKPERQSDLTHLRVLAQKLVSGHRVLELACGTGYWTQVLSQTADFVLGIDRSSEVLGIARTKSLPETRVLFAQADVARLPVRQSYFTAVFAGFWWSHIPKTHVSAFLLDLRRALGSGRLAIFVDNRFVSGSSTPISRTDEQGNTYQLRTLKRGDQFEGMKNFPSKAELRAAASEAGHEVRITELPYYWLLEFVTGDAQQGVPAEPPASR